jgi:hypothetical protein
MAVPPRQAAKNRAYGRAHRSYREQLRPWVESGFARCARCGYFIEPGQPFDLGHVDGSGKTLYSGPEHRLLGTVRREATAPQLDIGCAACPASGEGMRHDL